MIIGCVCIGSLQNLITAALFEPAKNGLILKPCIPMDGIMKEMSLGKTFIAIVAILISYFSLITLMTAPKNCFKECEGFEKDCGRRLYAAQVASLLVSKKIQTKMYLQKIEKDF